MGIKDQLYQYIKTHCQGKENALKFATLGNKLSFIEPLSWRLVAELIEQLRLEGKPIATCARGAFLPVTEEEKKNCLRTIYRRALNTLKTVKSLEKAFGRQIVEEVNNEFLLLSNGQMELTFNQIIKENVPLDQEPESQEQLIPQIT